MAEPTVGYHIVTAQSLNSSSLNATVATNDFSSESDELVLFRYVVSSVIIGIICFFGLIANLVSIVVLWKQQSKYTTDMLLRGLTFSDSIILILIFFWVLDISAQYRGNFAEYRDTFHYMFIVIYPLLSIVRMTTVWITVLLTIDRYIAVCKPLHAPRLCTLSRARRELILVVFIALVYNIPRFFEYKLVTGEDGKAMYSRTEMYKNEYYTVIYKISLYFIIMHLAPVLILVILNYRLIMTLRVAQQLRSDMAQGKPKGNSITRMVVMVVIVFFLCNIPTFISHTMWGIFHTDNDYFAYLSTPRNYISHIGNLLVTVNSSVNFIIYCTCSKKFRRTFLKTFCRFCYKRKDQHVTNMSMTQSFRMTSVYQNGSVDQ